MGTITGDLASLVAGNKHHHQLNCHGPLTILTDYIIVIVIIIMFIIII